MVPLVEMKTRQPSATVTAICETNIFIFMVPCGTAGQPVPHRPLAASNVIHERSHHLARPGLGTAVAYCEEPLDLLRCLVVSNSTSGHGESRAAIHFETTDVRREEVQYIAGHEASTATDYARNQASRETNCTTYSSIVDCSARYKVLSYVHCDMWRSFRGWIVACQLSL